VGPDFIDPGHHTKIAGRISRNLDGWMLSRARNLECFQNHTENADVAVVEGVMGLFDGYDGRSEAGSTAQIAKWLGLPILLVIDAKRMARSVAAVVQGFEGFDKRLAFAGVLFNNIAGSRHLAYLKEALEGNANTPCLGGIVHNETISIPERHLGLVTREDHPLAKETINRLADSIENSLDVEELLDRLPDIEAHSAAPETVFRSDSKRIRIGVAMDSAFCFYYQDNLDLLARFGAEIVCFSPTTDETLADDLDAIYFGGGYPELHAHKLSENRQMCGQILNRQRDGMPIYGECGGFMYLCAELSDLEGRRFPMVGCFPFATRMYPRLKALGYREVSFTRDTILGKRDRTVRGHEYHYSELTRSHPEPETVYRVFARAGAPRPKEGFQTARCLGSYIHLHFGSCPEAAESFVEICKQYRQERLKACGTPGN
jgi:cobyrinic acid a,c-diamide synthase